MIGVFVTFIRVVYRRLFYMSVPYPILLHVAQQDCNKVEN